jgi:hypothetical protein
MTKFRLLLLTALAVILACGICVQQGLAQEDDLQIGTGQLSMASRGGVFAELEPAGSAGLFQGIVAMGPNPATDGDWPCFAGGSGTGCSGIPGGGLVIGVPVQVWPLASANGQIYWTYETTTAHGKVHATVTVKQGSTTILNVSGSLGTIAANQIAYIDLTGATFTGAVAGPAAITVTTKVGTAKITGKATIQLK